MLGEHVVPDTLIINKEVEGGGGELILEWGVGSGGLIGVGRMGWKRGVGVRLTNYPD